MPVETFEYRSAAERVAMLQALAFVAQMHDLALSAPSGQVLDLCEQQALESGRNLLVRTVQQAVQTRIDQAEEKKGSTRLRVRGPAAAEATLQP
jgi:hypothetical protein